MTLYYNIFKRKFGDWKIPVVGETDDGLPVFYNGNFAEAIDPYSDTDHTRFFAESNWTPLGRDGIRAKQEEIEPGYPARLDEMFPPLAGQAADTASAQAG